MFSGASGARLESEGVAPLSGLCGDIKLIRCLRPPDWGALLYLDIRMVDQAKKEDALKLYLKTGEVVICNYNTGFIVPEMVKTRPVVVISKSSTHGRGLCTVVPLSTTPPKKVEAWHVHLQNVLRRLYPYSHAFGQSSNMWAKCDMIATVSFCRITRPHNNQDGRRAYAPIRLSDADLDAVFVGVRSYLPSAK